MRNYVPKYIEEKMNSSEKLYLGSAYYPEQWPEDRWLDDIQLMKGAGFTVTKMGEFAWSTFEPTEGEFHFSWLERAINLLAENNIVSVLGAPSAAPPTWLTQVYPNILAVDETGNRIEHDCRTHYCVNSPEYHEHTRRIVSKMAEHFGNNPNIIGWQIDNEFSRVCYCDTCQTTFQQYLVEKFKNINSLNENLNTQYWSQSYTSWDQIPIPKAGHNPGLMLAFQHFVTYSYKMYQKLQADILRAHIPEHVWLTHSFTNWVPTYDHYEMSADLNFASWDWYVPTGQPDYTLTGAVHDLVRGFKRKNFWIMQAQPGNLNWTSIKYHANKGGRRAMAWQAVGHGADAVLHGPWRLALNGQELYHGSLVDQSGQPRPLYDEVAQLGDEFGKVSELLYGSKIQAKVAILNDFNSRWSLDWQHQHKDFDYIEHLHHYYKPLIEHNIPVDIISADESLLGYRLVIAPGLVILTPERIRQIKEYIKRGGTLILTIRCGMKDENNSLLPIRQPGSLTEITNVEVEEYYPLDIPIPVSGKMIGDSFSSIWAERLRIIDEKKHTQPVAKYGAGNGWLDDQIAISYTQYGRGGIYYVGTYLDEEAQAKMLNYICTLRQVSPALTVPQGVEVCVRIKPDGKKIYILINHNNDTKHVLISWNAHEYLSGISGKGQLTLTPYGVAILTKAPE